MLCKDYLEKIGDEWKDKKFLRAMSLCKQFILKNFSRFGSWKIYDNRKRKAVIINQTFYTSIKKASDWEDIRFEYLQQTLQKSENQPIYFQKKEFVVVCVDWLEKNRDWAKLTQPEKDWLFLRG